MIRAHSSHGGFISERRGNRAGHSYDIVKPPARKTEARERAGGFRSSYPSGRSGHVPELEDTQIYQPADPVTLPTSSVSLTVERMRGENSFPWLISYSLSYLSPC